MEKEHNIAPYRLVKEWPCAVCDKTYARKKQLDDHVTAEHLGVRFPCIYCDKIYKYESALKSHVNLRHKEQKFDYNTLLKIGKDSWEYVVENNVSSIS